MLLILPDLCYFNLLLLHLSHYLISVKLTGIDPVQIRIPLFPKVTTTALQSMEKQNWNWEIPMSDQNRSTFMHLHSLCFHNLKLHLLKSKTKLHNQLNAWCLLCKRIILTFHSITYGYTTLFKAFQLFNSNSSIFKVRIEYFLSFLYHATLVINIVSLQNLLN